MVKVFISWSGEPSRTVAQALSTWLCSIVQAVEPWMSEDDIGSGKRWRQEIASALHQTDFGIVCVTRANQHQPWLLFESGALAKHLEYAQVIPLCIDLEKTDVSGPLADWQAQRLDRPGMYRVVSDINSSTPKPLPKDALTSLFDLTWPRFEEQVNDAKSRLSESKQPERSQREMLAELLDRVRHLERIAPRTGFTRGIGMEAALDRALVNRIAHLTRAEKKKLVQLLDSEDGPIDQGILRIDLPPHPDDLEDYDRNLERNYADAHFAEVAEES